MQRTSEIYTQTNSVDTNLILSTAYYMVTIDVNWDDVENSERTKNVSAMMKTIQEFSLLLLNIPS